MKIKNLFTLAVALLTIATACQKEPDLGPEEISISPAEKTYEFPEKGGTYTIKLTATVDWTIQGYDKENSPWLSIEPSSGKASASVQTITIKALANDGANRKADLVFYGNIMNQAPLTITQPGPDGDASSLTVAEFIEKADTENKYMLTGVAGDIATNEKYWGFSLKDDTGTISCPFIGENVEKFKNMNIHTGDTISIIGTYEFYTEKSEHQLSDGVIDSHKQVNIESIKTVTVQEFLTAKDLFTMYRMTGTVTGNINANFASFDLQDETGTVYVYRVNNVSEYGSKLKSGDKVTLRGAYTEYNGKDEVVDCTIESHEAGQGGNEEGQDPDPVPGDWIYSNSFNKGIGDFTIDNKLMNEPLSWVWNHDADYDCMKASAYAEKTNYESESWLISPVIDLDGETSVYLTFEHATNFFNGSTLEDEATIWAKEESASEWSKVSGINYPSSQSWTFVDAGDIDISAYAGKKMQFAFVYKSSASKAGTWEVKNVVVKNEADEVVPPTPVTEGSVILTFPDDNKDNNKVNDYDKPWTAISGDYSFTMTQFNNYNWENWTFVRCGRKTDSIAYIETDNAMPKLTSVEIAIGNRLDAADVKDLYLAIYSDADLTQQVGGNIETEDAFITNSIIRFNIPENIQAENLYYQLVFDCAASTYSTPRNGFIEISKISYIAAE